jgi:putative methionine-R-sulfoxide reductase with GAF domain
MPSNSQAILLMDQELRKSPQARSEIQLPVIYATAQIIGIISVNPYELGVMMRTDFEFIRAENRLA